MHVKCKCNSGLTRFDGKVHFIIYCIEARVGQNCQDDPPFESEKAPLLSYLLLKGVQVWLDSLLVMYQQRYRSYCDLQFSFSSPDDKCLTYIWRHLILSLGWISRVRASWKFILFKFVERERIGVGDLHLPWVSFRLLTGASHHFCFHELMFWRGSDGIPLGYCSFLHILLWKEEHSL